jgi:23S rRNA (pseudouridine1915-N3)-methyltransferase
MQINLVSIGTKMPLWIQAGFYDYAKRLPKECRLNLIEVPSVYRSQHANISKIIERESTQLLKAIPPNNRIVALDISGKILSTEKLAKELQSWMQQGQDTSLLIGGTDGLSQQCLEEAELIWSLSHLIFPHFLVRVIVAEQIYRAMSILKHHPYHRDSPRAITNSRSDKRLI